MSWSYYTALLAAGDLLTTGQRNELYDAFLERAEVAAPWLGSLTFSAGSPLRTSGFSTDLIERSSGGPVRLLDAIGTISAYYLRPVVIDSAPVLAAGAALGFSGTTAATTNLLNLAATAAGVSVAELDDLIANPLLDAWKRWNVIREAIRLLKYPVIGATGPTVHHADVSDFTWAGTKTAFFASEAAGFAGGTTENLLIETLYDATGSPPVGAYGIVGNRSTYTLGIPAAAAFTAGYTVVGMLSYGNLDTAGQSLAVDFGGALNVGGLAPYAYQQQAKEISASGQTATGSPTLEASILGYYDSVEMDNYEPAATPGAFKVGHVMVHSFAAKPTFTQP